MADAFLDITRDVCPMTFVRVKLKLESLDAGTRLNIRLNAGEPVENLPRSLQEDGYRTISLVADGDAFILIVEKPSA